MASNESANETNSSDDSDDDRDLISEDTPRRAILASVHLPDVDERDFSESLDELGRLAETLGLTVAGRVSQRRGSFESSSYLGPGKLEELAQLVKAVPEPTVVLLDHEVTPSQARNVKQAVSAAQVLDRTALILEIFHRHAQSRQAKLQVELVRLQYMAPRLRENMKVGDRQRGGIGGKGAGESQHELDRRKIRDRIAELRTELVALETEHKTRSARRQGLQRVALCGYTNAGKSTLFRALTHSDVYVADKLFATLDTTVRTLQPPHRQRVLMSDTIGFIRNLPTKLVASFKTTLDEALEASLILHVVDAADPAVLRHIETTRAVLAEIGAAAVPVLFVCNKVDKLPAAEPPPELAAFLAALPPLLVRAGRVILPGGVLASAKQPADVARVRQAILAYFDSSLVEAEIRVPYAHQEVRGVLFEAGEVLEEKFDETGVCFRVRIDAITLRRLQLAQDVQVTPLQLEKEPIAHGHEEES